MVENDFQKEIKKIAKRTKHERKQELVQDKARSKQKEKESKSYTAIIIAKLQYDETDIPSKEKLAEDLGSIIMKWADQKGFYGISPKEPIPKLISVEVDIK
jgi:hypothetical protein